MSDGWDGWAEYPDEPVGPDGGEPGDEAPELSAPGDGVDPYGDPPFGWERPAPGIGEESGGTGDTARDAGGDGPAGPDPYADDWYNAASSPELDGPGGEPAAGSGAGPVDSSPDDPADDSSGRPGPGPDDPAHDADGPAGLGYPQAAPPVGADPDLLAEPDGDDGRWDGTPTAAGFAAADWAARIEPVDGHPWADPGLLGEGGPDTPAGTGAAAPDGAPDPAELAGYAGLDALDGADPWSALAASDDPATSALARFWGAGGPAAPQR